MTDDPRSAAGAPASADERSEGVIVTADDGVLRIVTGRDTAGWGMIHRAVPAHRLDAAADELVAELRTSATVAVGLTERCIHTALDRGIVEAMADEALTLEVSSRTADFREGLRAFSERRDARFEGR